MEIFGWTNTFVRVLFKSIIYLIDREGISLPGVLFRSVDSENTKKMTVYICVPQNEEKIF